jgi:hypothetical protein
VESPDINVAFNPNFANTPAGTCSATPNSLIINNVSGTTLNIISTTLAGEFYFDNTGTSQSLPPASVPGFGSVSSSVYFCPPLPANGQGYTGRLTIISDDPDEGLLTYDLSGTEETP